MALQVAEMSVQVIETLRPLIGRIRARDRSLADQLTRAASSVCLNIAEAQHSDPCNRRARLFTAAGSASESLMAARVAVAWGYVSESDGKPTVALLDRLLAVLWRMTRG
jgi:four helix bundle protein